MRKLVVAFLTAIFLLGTVAVTADSASANNTHHGNPFDHSN